MAIQDIVPTFKYGYVVGKFVRSVGDAPEDVDRLPDLVPATDIRITFNRTQGQYVHHMEDSHGVFIAHETVKAGVKQDGTLTSDLDSQGKALPDSTSGIWLVTGQYKVNFGGFFPDMTIEVTEAHTQEAPLDLPNTHGFRPTPKQTVMTMAVPSGAKPGQVLSWDGMGLAWIDLPEGGI